MQGLFGEGLVCEKIDLRKIDLRKAINAKRAVQSAKGQACLGMWGVGRGAVWCFVAEQRGISSAGRAPALQAGGRRFDPVILHHLEWIKNKNKREEQEQTRANKNKAEDKDKENEKIIKKKK